MNAFLKLLLCGGLSADEYDTVKNSIVRENHKNLLLYSPVACVVFCLLLVASILTMQGPPSSNQVIYLVSCLAMGAIIPCAYILDRIGPTTHPLLVQVLSYVFLLTLHGFSIALSIAHSQYPAVSAIVFLLVNPLLFIDRPIRAMSLTLAATITICITSLCSKSLDLATDDIWNAVTFGLVALAVDVLTMRTKITQLHQALELAYLSTTDSLTQLRNRNNYEARLESYPRSGAKVLVCAYADANNLRETNNAKGHDAGDKLLRAIAHQMRKCFGEKDTYRIGGDEFVAFVLDGTADDAREKMRRMQEKLADKGYSVSCGAAEAEVSHVDMRSLVREAEREMYAQKRAHHANDSVPAGYSAFVGSTAE